MMGPWWIVVCEDCGLLWSKTISDCTDKGHSPVSIEVIPASFSEEDVERVAEAMHVGLRRLYPYPEFGDREEADVENMRTMRVLARAALEAFLA